MDIFEQGWHEAAELCRTAYQQGFSILILGPVASGKSTVKQLAVEGLPAVAGRRIATWNDTLAEGSPPTNKIAYLVLNSLTAEMVYEFPADLPDADLVRRQVHRGWLAA
jgi:hypothetical protein